MSNEKKKLTTMGQIADVTLDAETARLYLATVDMAKVKVVVDAIETAIGELSSTDRRSVDVSYACMFVISNAMLVVDNLSPQFRERVLSGFGDIMGAMLRMHIERLNPPEEEERPVEDPPKDEDQSRAKFDHLVDLGLGDIFTLEEYRNLLEDRAITDDDGTGHPAIRKDADTFYENTKVFVSPSEFSETDLGGATHICWYNK